MEHAANDSTSRDIVRLPLPSYQEAIGRPDWLPLVAPYVPIRDYARLCRVSRRFYAQFAGRLWKDPLSAVRRLGLHPNSGE